MSRGPRRQGLEIILTRSEVSAGGVCTTPAGAFAGGHAPGDHHRVGPSRARASELAPVPPLVGRPRNHLTEIGGADPTPSGNAVFPAKSLIAFPRKWPRRTGLQ